MLLSVKVWGGEPSCGRSTRKANLIKSRAVFAVCLSSESCALGNSCLLVSYMVRAVGVPGGSAQECPGSSSSIALAGAGTVSVSV